MSLQTRLEALVAAIGADIKALQNAPGGGSGTKVSALPIAGLLDGTEIVPIVQGGITERTTVSALRPWNEQTLTTTYINSTLTASDVFVGFIPLANTRYLIDALLTVQSNAATTGVQTALAGPTTGLTRSSVKIISASAATTDKVDHLAVNGLQIAVAGLTTPSLLSMQAIVEVGATPGTGNLRVQARSEVAIANGVQIFPGSSMRWRAI